MRRPRYPLMCALHPNTIITCICDVCVRMLNSSSKYESGMLQTFSLFGLVPARVKYNTFFPLACVYCAATIWLIRAAVVCPMCLSFHSLSLCRNARRCPLYPFRPISVRLYWTNKYLQGGFVRLTAWMIQSCHFMTGMNGLLCRLVIHTELVCFACESVVCCEQF